MRGPPADDATTTAADNQHANGVTTRKTCRLCQQSLPTQSYSRVQLKRHGARVCRSCIALKAIFVSAAAHDSDSSSGDMDSEEKGEWHEYDRGSADDAAPEDDLSLSVSDPNYDSCRLYFTYHDSRVQPTKNPYVVQPYRPHEKARSARYAPPSPSPALRELSSMIARLQSSAPALSPQSTSDRQSLRQRSELDSIFARIAEIEQALFCTTTMHTGAHTPPQGGQKGNKNSSAADERT
jgi:hypothetical protein